MTEISNLSAAEQALGPGYAAQVAEQQEQEVQETSIMEDYSSNETQATTSTTEDAIIKSFLDAGVVNEDNGAADKFVDGESAQDVPWCAAYSEYILENSGVELASWYQNVCNDNNKDGVKDSWTVKHVRSAAEEAGAMVDASQTQVGDVCFLAKNHMGVVAGVEPDGTICVVTGNSADEVRAFMIQPQDAAKYGFANTTGTDRSEINNFANTGEATAVSADYTTTSATGDKGTIQVANMSEYDATDNSVTGYRTLDSLDYFTTPSVTPTETPTEAPVQTPTYAPLIEDDDDDEPVKSTPTEAPAPSETPTEAPAPSETPTEAPAPSETPTEAPAPSETPTEAPAPSETPTEAPAPSETPTEAPAPSETPTEAPPCTTDPEAPITPENPPVEEEAPEIEGDSSADFDEPVPSETPTETPAPSETPTEAPPVTEAPTEAPAPSETPTEAPAPSETPTETPAPSETPTEAPAPSETPTEAPPATETPTEAPVVSDTPTEPPCEDLEDVGGNVDASPEEIFNQNPFSTPSNATRVEDSNNDGIIDEKDL